MNKVIIFSCVLLSLLVSCGTSEELPTQQPLNLSGRELFYSDSLNAFARNRPYPVPESEGTPAPKGYKPVYISSYARHGSRKLLGEKNTDIPISALSCADSIGHATPLGKEVLCKLRLIRDDMDNSWGDLTDEGSLQHKEIAERMCRNYPNVFSRKNTPVRLYSTPMQRTMLSMYACNEGITRFNPKIISTRQASESLKFLKADYSNPEKIGKTATRDFLNDYFRPGPVLDKLFTGEVPALKDTISFVNNLYECGTYVLGLGLPEADFIWDVFTMDELFILQQSLNYRMYIICSNSPQLGDIALSAVKPILRDFTERADTALEQKIPGADLRFGHDLYLFQLLAFIGVNGNVKREYDPLLVVDTFQDFVAAPMAGNLQLVFYRNRSGDVLVKFLQNEVESWIPIETDLYPYYHWDDVRDYFVSLIDN